MDLKIKDVAELLNVPIATIEGLLNDGKIPSYRLNHQYRFSRQEIENWVINNKNISHCLTNIPENTNSATKPSLDSSPARSPGGSKQFSLYRAIHKGGVLYDVPGETKEELIRAAVKMIAADLHLDAEVITELLLERENLQSTALNSGIAIPHTRDFLLNVHFDMVTVVFPKKPLPYGALDGKPVHTLFFLFASDDKRHLHLLAKIAHLSSQAEALNLLQSQPNKEQFLDYIKQWESSIEKKG